MAHQNEKTPPTITDAQVGQWMKDAAEMEGEAMEKAANRPTPYRYSYWAFPGKLMAGCCPGSIEPELIREHLSGLLDAGVTLVVNLMETAETELCQRFFESYEFVLPNIATARGHSVRMVRFPIADRSIPTTEQMTSILRGVRGELDAGGVVYVHCLGGIGRTGTVIGCYLIEQGQSNALEVLEALTAAEPEYFWPTPQTEEQRQFVLNWKPSP